MTIGVDTLYRALSTDSLLELRQAFQIDRQTVLGNADALAFVDDRLRLIARELETRTTKEDAAASGRA